MSCSNKASASIKCIIAQCYVVPITVVGGGAKKKKRCTSSNYVVKEREYVARNSGQKSLHITIIKL